MMRRLSFGFTIAALAGALAACGPLVQIGGNAKAPVSLLALISIVSLGSRTAECLYFRF